MVDVYIINPLYMNTWYNNKICYNNNLIGTKPRASINFQTQEVPDFLPLKFGSPTGKSRKSHFFSVLRRSALSLVEHRFLFQCHTESSWYMLLLDVF